MLKLYIFVRYTVPSRPGKWSRTPSPTLLSHVLYSVSLVDDVLDRPSKKRKTTEQEDTDLTTKTLCMDCIKRMRCTLCLQVMRNGGMYASCQCLYETRCKECEDSQPVFMRKVTEVYTCMGEGYSHEDCGKRSGVYCLLCYSIGT